MAKAAYECGEIEIAKKCTSQMDRIKPNSAQVLINMAFLNLIEGNTKFFLQQYEKIFISRDKYLNSPVSLIEFLNKQKGQYPNFNIYFDFAIGTINKLYADEQFGQHLLGEVLHASSADNAYTEVNVLARKIYLLDLKKDFKTTLRRSKNKKKK
jgi:hypothetical protein